MSLPFFKLPLDVPAYPADRYAPLADRLRRLLSTRSDLVFIQAEALLALEASAISLARPGIRALNIVTSPYGAYFGAWLRRGGATVEELTASPGQPIRIDAVSAALDAHESFDIMAVVHGEGANGALNPLPEIAELARRRGALIVVDAVASFGAHPLELDRLGIDIAVIGPQKALSGPAGLSAVTVSDRAWGAHRQNRGLLALVALPRRDQGNLAGAWARRPAGHALGAGILGIRSGHRSRGDGRAR